MEKIEQATPKKYTRFFIWLILLILSVLLLVAVSIDSNKIIRDYEIILEEQIGFLDVLRMDFPDLYNPIGPFGACLSYWLCFLLGKVLCIALLLGMAMLSFLSLFTNYQDNILGKVINFVIMAFFLNILVLTVTGRQPIIPGIITGYVRTFLNGIFGTAGTIIISIVFTVVMLIFIFELRLIGKFFLLIFNGIKYLIGLIFKKKDKRDFKPRRIEKKEVKEKSIPPKVVIHNEPLPDDKTDLNETRQENPEDDIDIEQLELDIDLPDKKLSPTKPKKRLLKKDNAKQEDKSPKLTIPQRKSSRNYQPPKDGKFALPDIAEFLADPPLITTNRDEINTNIAQVSRILEDKLAEFQVKAKVKNVNIGPIVTQYELKPAPGVKVSKFSTLSKDLALALKAKSLRVEAPIPGRGLVGIEIPNIQRDIIFLRNIMLSPKMKEMKSKLAFGLGKDIAGNPVVADLAKMPHLLIAGATGSGKSVCVNSIIVSLLLRATPQELRLILIDPKRIELAGYEGVPHLIQNVVTEPDHVMIALNWAVSEMERRYKLLHVHSARNLEDYNKKIRALRKQDEEFTETELPFIVLVIDEFSDLIMTASKEIERPITRLAQMARAIGIHLILATQRPSNKVITGLIKANFPSRIAFKVSQKINSRVILDTNGAEQLLGKGDSLFLGPGKAIPERIHGAYVSDEEINNLVDYLRVQPKPDDEITIIQDDSANLAEFDYDDPLFPEAAFSVVSAGAASVSMLQRHFKIGYARAGRLIDLLEQANIVGPHLGSKSREVIATTEDLRASGFLPEENL